MLEMWGYPAKIVVQVELPRASVTVPITDVSLTHYNSRLTELRIPLKGDWMREVSDAINQVEFRVGK